MREWKWGLRKADECERGEGGRHMCMSQLPKVQYVDFEHVQLHIGYKEKAVKSQITAMPSTSFNSTASWGASMYDVRKCFGFYDPPPSHVQKSTNFVSFVCFFLLVTVTNQLILFLSSAFWGPSLPPPTADVIYGSPPAVIIASSPELNEVMGEPVFTKTRGFIDS